MSKPQLIYFPVRGRGEVIKLTFALAKADYDLVEPDRAAMKADDAFLFGQAPRLQDGDLSVCQSNSILRYVGAKYALAGTTPREQCVVDMICEGVEGLRGKYLALIYQAALSAEAKEAYFKTHIDKATVASPNGGVHFLYLSKLLAQNKTGSGFAVGSAPTIADIAVFDITDLHVRITDDKFPFTAEYPDLLAHHKLFSELAGVKEYLASSARLDRINAVPLG
ncbi:MAG: hypothetical protein WDW36_001412 [Sanguina aurantia]